MFTPKPADLTTAYTAGLHGVDTYAEDGRMMFAGIDREYGTSWTFAYLTLENPSVAPTTGEPITKWGVYVRKAPCGAGCRCAAEFTTAPLEHGIDELRIDMMASQQGR